ncbi:MAG: DUF4230 domain-containing protein [Solobacterium sp.]|nr:DUF4230 domain-containing protein [Solobacterium sp.]
MEENTQQEMQELIEASVQKAVKKSIRQSNMTNTILDWVFKAFLVLLLFFGYQQIRPKNPEVKPVEEQDLTFGNNGIFGFTAADFEDVILGQATRQQLLVVDEQEVSVASTITNTGLFNLSVFTKVMNQTIYGIGQYTIDLTQIKKDDIKLDEENYTLTISVPYPELHKVIFEPDKTKIGDVNKGWLAFGDIKLTPEQTKTYEVEANTRLEERLNEKECYETAVRFAKLTAYELYQPLVSSVSPAYKVEIVVKEAPTN